MSDANELTIRLSPDVATAVRQLADDFECSPTELVRVGLGMVKLVHQAQQDQLKVAVVTHEGKPLREIILPELKAFKQSSIDDTVRRIIEDVHPSPLQRAISDLDPDNPNSKGSDGMKR